MNLFNYVDIMSTTGWINIKKKDLLANRWREERKCREDRMKVAMQGKI